MSAKKLWTILSAFAAGVFFCANTAAVENPDVKKCPNSSEPDECSSCENGVCTNNVTVLPNGDIEITGVGESEECIGEDGKIHIMTYVPAQESPAPANARTVGASAEPPVPYFLRSGAYSIFAKKGADVVKNENGLPSQIRTKKELLNFSATANSLRIGLYRGSSVATKTASGTYALSRSSGETSAAEIVQKDDGTIEIIRYDYSGGASAPKIKSETTAREILGTNPLRMRVTHEFRAKSGANAVPYKREVTEFTWVPDSPTKENTLVIETSERGSDDVWRVVSRRKEIRATYSQEDGEVALYTCDAVDENGTPLADISTETWMTYYDDVARDPSGSFGKLKTLRRSDGYWEKVAHIWNPHAKIKGGKTYSPWLDSAYPEGDYNGSAPEPAGTHRLRSEIDVETTNGMSDYRVSVGGVALEANFSEKRDAGGELLFETTHRPHAGGDAVREIVRYRNDVAVADYLRGKPVSRVLACGMREFYTYDLTDGVVTVTSDSGYGNEGGIVNGERTVTKTNYDTGEEISVHNYAIADGVAHATTSKEAVEWDATGRPTKWIYDGNAADYSSIFRGCCHVTSERRRDGSQFDYTYKYDGNLHVSESRGVKTITDFHGLEKTVWKQLGDDASTRFLVRREVRDLAGNLVSVTVPAPNGATRTTRYETNIAARTRKEIDADGNWTLTEYFADGQVKRVTSNLYPGKEYAYAPSTENGGGLVTTETTLLPEGSAASASPLPTSVRVTDLQGNLVRETVNGATTRYFYAASGVPAGSLSPDGVRTIQSKDCTDHELLISGVDLNGDGVLDPADDRMTKTEKVFDCTWPENVGSWKTTQSFAFEGDFVVLRTTWRSADGTRERVQQAGVAGFSETQSASWLVQTQSSWTTSSSSPTGAVATTTFTRSPAGWLQSVSQVVSAPGTEETFSSSYVLDAFGNRIRNTDARGNATNYSYDTATGLTLSSTDAGGRTTSYVYDSRGLLTQTTLPDGATQCREYDARGNVIRQWGAQQYPVAFAYDAFNRMVSMTTCRAQAAGSDFPEGAAGDVTTWTYDSATGFLVSKRYADGKGFDYTCTPGGRLSSRTDARGNVAHYSYNSAGDLAQVSYTCAAGVPAALGVVYGYNQLGQQISIFDARGARTLTYDANHRLASETDPATGTAVALAYDSFGRVSQKTLLRGNESLAQFSRSYDASGRISSAGMDGTEIAAYGYLSGTPLLASQTLGNGVLKNVSYEQSRDLPTALTYSKDAVQIAGRAYAYNVLGQVTARVQTRGNAVSRNDAFGYNARGELVSVTLGSAAYAYDFDAIGNRVSAEELAEETVYASNGLNQYLHMTTERTGESSVFIPVFDADGNQTSIRTSTGTWHVVYNAESRPVRFENTATQSVVEMSYDSQGRRFEKKVTVAGTVVLHERYAYDGYLQIAAFDVSTDASGTEGYALKRSVLWDPAEATATRPLAVKNVDESGNTALYYCTHDLTKNVCELLDGNGTVAATYDYAPFGAVTETVPADAVAPANPFQWSSEVYDSELDLVYYNYRHYSPSDGRWLSRDPIEEQGGYNLYGFVGNNILGTVDIRGQAGHIAGGVILGCAGGAAYSLFSSFLSGDSKCQCLCKAGGACAVGAVAGALASANPAWSPCLLGIAGGAINSAVNSLCNSACSSSGDTKPVCIVVSTIISLAGGCIMSKHGGNLDITQKKIVSLLSNIIGADVDAICNNLGR